MAKSKVEIEAIIAAKNAALALDNLSSKMNQMLSKAEQKTKDVNKKADDAGKGFGLWDKAIGQAQSRLLAFGTGLLSIRTGISLIRQEFENIRRIQDEALARTVTFSELKARFANVMPSLEKQRQDGVTLDDMAKIAMGSPDPVRALDMLRGLYTVGTDKKSAIDIGRFFVETKPEMLTDPELRDQAVGMLQLRQHNILPGASNEALFQYINAVSGASPVGPGELSRNLMPAMGLMARSGFSPQMAGGLAASMTSFLQEDTGETTRTLLTNLPGELERAMLAGGVDKLVGRRVQGDDMINFLRGAGEFGDDKFTAKRTDMMRKLFGVRTDGMSDEEFAELQKAVAQINAGKKGDDFKRTLTEFRGKFAGGRGPAKAALMALLTNDQDQLEAAMAEIGDQEHLEREGARKAGEKRLDPVLAANIEHRKFVARREINPKEAARAEARQIIEDAVKLTGGTTVERTLRSALSTLDTVGKGPTEAIGSAVDMLRRKDQELGEVRHIAPGHLGAMRPHRGGIPPEERDELRKDLQALIAALENLRTSTLTVKPANPVGRPLEAPMPR